MFFHRIHFFGFLLLILQFQQASALTFRPIVGPFVIGAPVPVGWTLDGSEPLNGWELWFDAGGSGIKLADIAPLTTSTVVSFPGSNGTFQGFSGPRVLAISNEVDLAFVTGTATFSATVISGSSSFTSGSSSSASITATSPPSESPSSVAESAMPSKSSAFTTEALLGIVVGTLAVIANAYPFDAADVEKQLAKQITPFHAQAPPIFSPPRVSSLLPPPLPTAVSASSSDLQRQAYLNSQLQKLQVAQQNHDPESGSIVFGPLSSVPSEAIPRPFDLEAEPPPSSPPLQSIPESSSRRTAYLMEQLQRLEVVERRPSNGSVAFGPLSSVPSESTVRPYAPSITTSVNSPIQFLQHTATSPVSPTTRYY
ncbi:hypothetical protein B0H19DRAFT_715159 [Mycena capillaripes]|nr:hypothetical protein B0H19DRAFT_715159 [Mycena capillaripes]